MADKIRELKTQMRGRWRSFFTGRYGGMFSHSKGQPCPVCGGEDRFVFDDKFGDGNWLCRHECSGRQSSDGLELVKLLEKTDIKGAITVVESYLGGKKSVRVNTIEEMEPVPEVTEAIGGTCHLVPAPDIQYKPGATLTVWLYARKQKATIEYEYFWDWINPDGIREGYIGRTDKKICHQIFWLDEHGWTVGTLGDNRPAFVARLDKPIILIVEGEKAALQVAAATNKYSVVTWTGGASACHCTNWDFLKGREVYLFPDNDKPGIEAMNKLYNSIKNSCRATIINPPSDAPPKWDLGNLTEDIFADFDEEIKAMIEKKEAPLELIAPEDTSLKIRELIRPLGFLDGNCYIMHWHKDERKQVYVQEVEAVGSKGIDRHKLMFWKEWDDWKRLYGEKVSLDDVIPDIVGACKSQGVYDATKIRGAGFWEDKGRTVFHAGTRLYLNEQVVDLSAEDLEFIYQSRPPMVSPAFDFKNQLTPDEKRQILRVLCTSNVSKLTSIGYILGWLILAVQSGRLKWRPHMYIEGKTGSGKSSIFRVARTLMGPGVEDITDSPTEASIRQRLGSDARPILFDESEAKNRMGEHEREKINGLKRASCSDSEAIITRGTASGRAQIFKPRFMILEAGINKPKADEANLNREIEIEVLHKSIQPDWDDVPFYLEDILSDPLTFAEAFGEGGSGGIVSEWADSKIWDRFIASAHACAPETDKNFNVFKKEILKVADGRAGDTHGIVLGAFSAFMVGEVMENDEKTIEAFLDRTIWNAIAERKQEETTEVELLKYINQMPIQIEDEDGRKTTNTIVAALLEIKTLWDHASKHSQVAGRAERYFKTEISYIEHTHYQGQVEKCKSIFRALGLLGITLKKYGDEYFVFFANKNQVLAQKMSGTSYHHRWNSILKRLQGTEPNISFRCPSQQSQKGLKIPYSPYFLCEDDEQEEPCQNENINPEEPDIDLF